MPLQRFRSALPAFSLVIASMVACASSAPLPAPRELPTDARQRNRMLATFGQRLESLRPSMTTLRLWIARHNNIWNGTFVRGAAGEAIIARIAQK